MSAWPRSPERCANTQRCNTAGCKALATSTAALAIKPSTTITRRSCAACSTAPTMVAISKPPNAAKASSGLRASGWRANTSRKMPILRCTASASSPVPAPVQSATANPARRASSSDAAEVLPMPISPSSSALPGSVFTSAAPLASAVSHWAAVMAGPSSASAVPGATL